MQLIRLWGRQDFATVSDEDFAALQGFRWTFCNGYARRWCGGGYLWMQHAVTQRMGLVIPHGFEVDHVDRWPLNNTRENLRIVTRNDNNLNRSYYLRQQFEPYVTPL